MNFSFVNNVIFLICTPLYKYVNPTDLHCIQQLFVCIDVLSDFLYIHVVYTL